ncbi:hypothetical protein VTJ83DRAFT_7264 [Remersonia thermophila]|uniref:U1 small nuclear ribonucleoprotein C n=2 Tax=Sordariomycetidae TaxID=222544 RepID=A0ABR4D413_9PEZI
MPKFFCDYCDVYLTHDSMSVRKAHNSGRNHLRNVIDYYQQIGHEKAQSVIDSITSSYAAEGQAHANPMLPHNQPGGGSYGLGPGHAGLVPPPIPLPGFPGAPPLPPGMPAPFPGAAPGAAAPPFPPPASPLRPSPSRLQAPPPQHQQHQERRRRREQGRPPPRPPCPLPRRRASSPSPSRPRACPSPPFLLRAGPPAPPRLRRSRSRRARPRRPARFLSRLPGRPVLRAGSLGSPRRRRELRERLGLPGRSGDGACLVHGFVLSCLVWFLLVWGGWVWVGCAVLFETEE